MSSARPLIVAAPDSFKGSCSAVEAAEAMLAGARQVYGDDAEYLAVPLADGGEGTLDAILNAWGIAARETAARDALGRPRIAQYGLSIGRTRNGGAVAVIEAAEANGLPWVSDVPLRPLDASTEGVGDIVLDVLDSIDASEGATLGQTEILLCIGGSATSDGGTGMLRALGVRFLDEGGDEVPPGAVGLERIAQIDVSGLDPRAAAARWRIAVDVQFPLCGPRGAGAVFGPQKGASGSDVRRIDAGLSRLAGLLAERNGIHHTEYTERPGFGAAGGIPLAAVALLGAETVAGSTVVSDTVDLPGLLERASLVFTGEGRLDEQSVHGKVVDLVARTVPAGVPVVVIAGAVALSARECAAAGITAAFSIAPGPATLERLISETPERIAETVAQVCALVRR